MTDQREPPRPLHHVVEGAPVGGAVRGDAVVAGAPEPRPSEVADGRVVLVHGFTQTLAAWGPVGGRLGRRRGGVRGDLPGSGGGGRWGGAAGGGPTSGPRWEAASACAWPSTGRSWFGRWCWSGPRRGSPTRPPGPSGGGAPGGGAGGAGE